EARQAQIRETRDDAFLTCRKRHESVVRRYHVVHGQQNLAMSTDREAIHGRDPWLFNAAPAHIVRNAIGPSDAAPPLVHQAKGTLQKPHERNLAAIEVSEVDAAAQHTPTAVSGMVEG